MSDYIKREDAIEQANMWSMFGPDNMVARLKRLPRADVVEVKHGYWRLVKPSFRNADVFVCSLCRNGFARMPAELMNYCPSCGAKMDGKVKG